MTTNALPGIDESLLAQVDDAEIHSAKVRRVFEATHDAEPWMEDYWALLAEGWSWRQAVYLIWASQPKARRNPTTQEELAVEVLGLRSDRAIRRWRAHNPAIEARIARLAASALAHARADVYDALIAAASNPNPRAHADRRLALEMLGDYVPKQRIIAETSGGDYEETPTDELAAIAQVPVDDGDSSDADDE